MATSCDSNVKHNNNKKVRFVDDRVEIELDISDEERRAKWMSLSDFRKIQNDIFSALESTANNTTFTASFGDDDDDDTEEETTYRGLEAMMNSYRRESIQHFIQDFLEIQEEMRMTGQQAIMGNRSLAGFAEKYSKSARERARLIADQDAFEARRVYEDLQPIQHRQ